MNAFEGKVSHEDAAVSGTTDHLIADVLPPTTPISNTGVGMGPRMEIKTLVQDITYAEAAADTELAGYLNDEWEILDLTANTVVEYVDNGRAGANGKLRHVRIVTLMRLVEADGDDEDTTEVAVETHEPVLQPAEAVRDENAIATEMAQVIVPTIVITSPVPEPVILRRIIVGRDVTLAQATNSGEYSDAELAAIAQRELAAREFAQMAAFIPVLATD